MDIRHENHGGKGRFSTPGGKSELTYTMAGETTAIFEHTYVPASERGQGIAAKLLAAAVDWARGAGLTVVPQCSYVQAQFRRHPEYRELL